VPFLIDAFMISSGGSAIYEAHCFRRKEDIPSGLVDFLFFMLFIIFLKSTLYLLEDVMSLLCYLLCFWELNLLDVY